MKTRIGKTQYDLDEMSREDLLDLKVEVDQSIDAINMQLQDARNRLAIHGEYSDSNWYWRTNTALRHRKRASQAIQAALGKKTKKRKSSHAERFGNTFIDVARELLVDDTFNHLLQETMDRIDTEKIDGR